MRFIAKHRKIINAIIIIICFVAFVYLVIRTRSHIDVDVDAHVYSGIAMGTAVKKTIYAENTSISDEVDGMIDDCLQELEKQISVRIDDSEIAIMNRSYAVGGIYKLSDNIIDYLRQELQIFKETKGAFSPCIYPISSLWGIENGSNIIPDDSAIQSTLQYTDGNNIEMVENGVIFHKKNMMIDLGATGKGIACDEIKKELVESNIHGAVVSIGGSILAYGDKGDGKEWHIGIQDPKGETGTVLGIIDVKGDVIISTSGDYEKYFEVDGKRYHHIFDPETGYPANSGLISVTIISDSGILSDALSTACFVMGLEDGMAYTQEKGVEAIFVTSDRKIYVTDGIKKSFRLQADGYEVEK